MHVSGAERVEEESQLMKIAFDADRDYSIERKLRELKYFFFVVTSRCNLKMRILK